MSTRHFLFAATFIFTSFFTAHAVRAQEADKKSMQRNYPGGQDEEDLKVQSELQRPTTIVDRKSLEQRVLKNFLKKAEEATESTPTDPKTE